MDQWHKMKLVKCTINSNYFYPHSNSFGCCFDVFLLLANESPVAASVVTTVPTVVFGQQPPQLHMQQQQQQATARPPTVSRAWWKGKDGGCASHGCAPMHTYTHMPHTHVH